MFRIDLDPVRNELHVSVRGFWTREDVPALARALHARLREARRVGDRIDVIVESFDFPVQANDVADLLADVMRGGMPLTSGRVAVVVGSQLNRLQAERTLVHPRVKVFMTIAAARRWLDSDEAASPS